MTTEITIDTGTNELLCVIRDRVAIITLNRPEVRNAMSDTLTPALRTMIKTCGENPEVFSLYWGGWRDLNPWPLEPQPRQKCTKVSRA